MPATADLTPSLGRIPIGEVGQSCGDSDVKHRPRGVEPELVEQLTQATFDPRQPVIVT